MVRRLPQLTLALLGAAMVQAWASGRLMLLMAQEFHGLVLGSGLVLLMVALLSLLKGDPLPRRRPRAALVLAVVATLIIAIPPRPSFSLLGADRKTAYLEGLAAGFALPPDQRTLVDWARILRNSSDPGVFQGQAVKVQGFVLQRKGAPPSLARLVLRCCLADATPVELAVRWPQDGPEPREDQWLEVIGSMEVRQGPSGVEAVVIPQRIRPIPRPKQPFSA